MAGRAFSGRAVKNAVHVATLAAYRAMRPAKLKTREGVIEVEPGRFLPCCVDGDHKGKQHECKAHRAILWPRGQHTWKLSPSTKTQTTDTSNDALVLRQ